MDTSITPEELQTQLLRSWFIRPLNYLIVIAFEETLLLVAYSIVSTCVKRRIWHIGLILKI